MHLPTEDTSVKLIIGNTTQDLSSVRQLVFGELAEIAQPIVKEYHSDLYWDAIWLHANLSGTGTFRFFWSCDKSGTAITQDPGSTFREHTFSISVELSNSGVTMLVRPLAVNARGELVIPA
jgi:hypothetical protein